MLQTQNYQVVNYDKYKDIENWLIKHFYFIPHLKIQKNHNLEIMSHGMMCCQLHDFKKKNQLQNAINKYIKNTQFS